MHPSCDTQQRFYQESTVRAPVPLSPGGRSRSFALQDPAASLMLRTLGLANFN